MNRNDYNLIAAVLRQAIADDTARPALAMRFVEAFVRRGDKAPDFVLQDFINRCVPPKEQKEMGKIDPGREAPAERVRSSIQTEDDASLFAAILATEFPHLAGIVGCALSMKLPGAFSIGKSGGKVWIRFGKQALTDPVGAVKRAAPDAEALAFGQSAATKINGR